MEALRLAPYTSLTDTTAFPPISTEYYSPAGQATGNGGTAYTVTYNCAPVASTLPAAYKSNVCFISVTAAWMSGGTQHTRSNRTYVSRFGIQRYVAGN